MKKIFLSAVVLVVAMSWVGCSSTHPKAYITSTKATCINEGSY